MCIRDRVYMVSTILYTLAASFVSADYVQAYLLTLHLSTAEIGLYGSLSHMATLTAYAFFGLFLSGRKNYICLLYTSRRPRIRSGAARFLLFRTARISLFSPHDKKRSPPSKRCIPLRQIAARHFHGLRRHTFFKNRPPPSPFIEKSYILPILNVFMINIHAILLYSILRI